MTEWLAVACRRDVVRRALKVAAVVGTVLVAINQGNVLASAGISTEVLAKIALTYCVPYGVSTYASVQAIRAESPPDSL